MSRVPQDRRWNVEVGDEETTAVSEPLAAPSTGAVFVCAHGAGGHMADRGMSAAAWALGDVGLGVVASTFSIARWTAAGRIRCPAFRNAALPSSSETAGRSVLRSS